MLLMFAIGSKICRTEAKSLGPSNLKIKASHPLPEGLKAVSLGSIHYQEINLPRPLWQ